MHVASLIMLQLSDSDNKDIAGPYRCATCIHPKAMSSCVLLLQVSDHHDFLPFDRDDNGNRSSAADGFAANVLTKRAVS